MALKLKATHRAKKLYDASEIILALTQPEVLQLGYSKDFLDQLYRDLAERIKGMETMAEKLAARREIKKLGERRRGGKRKEGWR